MPGLFEQFPHTNLHELNLDWLINMINQFKEELENSAVLSVNGETGHVTLYESENVILPALPSGVDQWRLVRLMGGQYVGILFYNGHAYIQRGNENMRLLTLEDIPTSSGVVSWNGLTGVVNVTGQDIPVDDAADADSIYQAITNEHTERVNADNALQNSITTLNTAVSNINVNDTAISLSSAETGADKKCRKIGKLLFIDFTGVTRTHSENETIFTLNEGFRPVANMKITGNISGKSVIINIEATTGEAKIFLLNGATTSARLYFNGFIPIA